MPAFVSTLSICIVFVPVFLLSGSAKFLFVPLAEAVVFAMLASYLLSRTLIPTLVKYLLRSEIAMYQHPHDEALLEPNANGNERAKRATAIIWRFHFHFNRG